MDSIVEQLKRAVNLPPVAVEPVGWSAVEASLGGITLPDDYKEFVEHFPPGRLAGALRIVRPGDMGHSPDEYLGRYEHVLQDMREWRDDGDGNFPFPIFPETGGVLPWATGSHGTCFWLTEDADPGKWPVVCSDNDFVEWQTFPMAMTDFLWSFINHEIENPFKPEASLPGDRNRFEVATVTRRPASQSPPIPVPANEERSPFAHATPRNQVVDLLNVLGCSQPADTDWPTLEATVGRRLPPDYKTVIDSCGVGDVGDIRLAGCDECSEYNLLSLNEYQRQYAAEAGIDKIMSFHPSPHGLLCWGRTTDGLLLNWKTIDPDPAKWCVAVVDTGNRVLSAFLEELSFSSFLLTYFGYEGNPTILAGRQPWTGEISYTRHMHSQ